MSEQFETAISYIKSRGVDNPEVGIILGTGLGGLVKEIEVIEAIDYNEIPYFPVSTVESHHGKLIYGHLGGKKILAMQGRFHFYEGYSFEQIVFPVRVLKLLGIKQLLISNAAGAVNNTFKKASLMLITDHINLLPGNPLLGKNDEKFGVRFPDMSAPYDPRMNELLKNIAKKNNIQLHEGVYVPVSGPNLETRAEYRYIRKMGGDAVGMSTVPEVIAANHMNLPCCAISVLTDECDPEKLAPVDIADILAAAAQAEPELTSLYANLIAEL